MADELAEAVSQMANSLLDGTSHIKLLEAGCGSASHVSFEADIYAVGIDISQEQLARNGVLNEKILGDIQEYSLPKEEFDVAVCWMVLEHLSRPTDALHNLFDAIKPQGLLILGFPNLLSIKGVVTKMTPFWFHRLFYQFMKNKSSPFPTYLRVAMVPERLVRFAEENGFSAVFFQLVEGGTTKKVKNRSVFIGMAFQAVDSLVRVVSLGKSQSLLLDQCAVILRKRAESKAV